MHAWFLSARELNDETIRWHLAGILVLVMLGWFARSAHAACYEWDNAYEYQCWGPWIKGHPKLYDECKGDPFDPGGDDWIFGIAGPRPRTPVPTRSAAYRGHLGGARPVASGGLLFPPGTFAPVSISVRA